VTRTAWTPASPWPTADEQLLLRAALLDGGGALDAWRRFRDTHDGIDHLDGDAYRLLPQLFRNLQAYDSEDPALGRLKGIYRHTWYVNQLLMRAGSHAVALLEADCVDTMLFDGGALVACHVRDVGDRPMDSCGVLVHPHDAERSLAILSAHGWTSRDRLSPRQLTRTRRSVALVKEEGGHLVLHWSALFPGSYDEELWSDAVKVSLGGVETLAPSPTDQLLLACVEGLGWTPAPLRWIPDATLLIRSISEAIDWRSLVVRARQRAVALDLADALEFLVVELQLELPRELPAWLRQRAERSDRLLHGLKMMPQRRAVFWRLARRTARACDATRRLATSSPPAARRREKLVILLDGWGARARRATARRAVRKGVGWFSRARTP
jgi:hypothetical protein